MPLLENTFGKRYKSRIDFFLRYAQDKVAVRTGGMRCALPPYGAALLALPLITLSSIK
jgi:hypothetical protein